MEEVSAYPRISCVIPTHLRSNLLQESLASVLQQTRAPFEVIVVSDCIDPPSRKVVEKLAEGIEFPVKYVERDSTSPGASLSRNIGASYASGDFIAFLDDDDMWESSYISDAVDRIQETNADVIVTWRRIFTETSDVLGPTIEEGLRAQDVLAVSLGTTGSNLIVRLSSFHNISGFDEKLPVKNDTDFFYRLLKSGSNYRVVRRHSVLQRKHSQGQLTGKTERRAAGTEAYIEKHRADLTRSDLRHLRLNIHRIRKANAEGWRLRSYHHIMAILNYSPRKYFEERRDRKMWHSDKI